MHRLICLCCCCLLWWPRVWAYQLDEVQLNHYQQQAQMAFAPLKSLLQDHDFDRLEHRLRGFDRPTEEALRLSLVQSIQPEQLNAALVTWLANQPNVQVMVSEQGDGYVLRHLAFDYAAPRQYLLSLWFKNGQQQRLYQDIENNGLSLSLFLMDVERRHYQQRRDNLIAVIPSLSHLAIQHFRQQFLDQGSLIWLPDNGVLSALAQRTGDPALYHLLWRRRADHYSLAALNALAQQSNQQWQIQQLLVAAENQGLRKAAIMQLAQLQHLAPASTAQLLSQISTAHGEDVAVLMQQAGHQQWLAEQLTKSQGMARKHLLNALNHPIP
ncbi:hypothetical protein VST7929_00057 [Vibrio stylophorae]|uniref:HEAT repeat domain-containing protein n=1 Tax=Vibrio stylophorae TaxID=659351 RepID=A0ABM8ZPN6_9VIBR|nr:hypothetical protein [Vibrio stylophorae]CAH0532246.1 hypothetical protein VST7929_00057 [Vibrio stylophorae]